MLAGVLVSGCGGTAPRSAPDPPSRSATAPSVSAAPSRTSPTSPVASPSGTPTPTAHRPRTREEKADPRWRFYTRDRTRHTSPWFAGRHRVMIGYGCTRAPYYSHDPRCPGRQGFHHGIDVAMPCGTPLTAGRRGRVLDPGSPGTPGPAYGPFAFRIRSGDVDILIGHVRKVYVGPGDPVRPGQRIARASDAGAPDGCHLHFEVRRAGGGLAEAVDPAPYLDLS